MGIRKNVFFFLKFRVLNTFLIDTGFAYSQEEKMIESE